MRSLRVVGGRLAVVCALIAPAVQRSVLNADSLFSPHTARSHSLQLDGGLRLGLASALALGIALILALALALALVLALALGGRLPRRVLARAAQRVGGSLVAAQGLPATQRGKSSVSEHEHELISPNAAPALAQQSSSPVHQFTSS